MLGKAKFSAKRFKRSLAIAASLLHSSLASAAYSQPQMGGELTIARPAGLSTLDPYAAVTLQGIEIVHHIFESLVEIDEKYNHKLMLASRCQRRCYAICIYFARGSSLP